MESRTGKGDENSSLAVISKYSHVNDVPYTCVYIIKEEICDNNYSEQNSTNLIESSESMSHTDNSSHEETSKEQNETDVQMIEVKQENTESDEVMDPETRRNWVISLPFDLH